MKDHITIDGHDGAFAAYIARPKTSPAPAVVVLQEVFGVNADIRKTCDELAEQGFYCGRAGLILASGAGRRPQPLVRCGVEKGISPIRCL
jgi:hypothetical protein